ncbi:MAG: hypothetical protein WBN75_10555, partial [Verrucomicrobiia bacterium]
MRLAHYAVVRGSNEKDRKLQIVGTDTFSETENVFLGGSGTGLCGDDFVRTNHHHPADQPDSDGRKHDEVE